MHTPRPNTHPAFETFTPIANHLRPRSTLEPDRWRHLLSQYPDPSFSEIILGIATHGARLGYQGPRRAVRGRNHPSVLRIHNEITDNITSEIAAQRVFEIKHLPQSYFISPLGAVEKKAAGIRTGWRRIHDLSYPLGRSVNDGIPEAFGTLTYQTFDDAVRLVAKHGRRTILRKRDLKDAFRMIPVSPYDYWLLMFAWEGSVYVDIFLPFGLRTSPFLFNLFSEGLHWILEAVFNRELVHYLDDFLLVNDPDPEFFGALASHLGLPEKTSKRMDGYVVDFTGIELDSDKMEARLPRDKHDRALSSVNNLLAKGAVSFRSLERLLGFLNFCARVIPLGRPFLRNLFNLLRRLSPRDRYTLNRLPKAARRDLTWWATLLPNWSGIRIINPARSIITLHTDASGKKGIGGWWGDHAFSSRIPRTHRGRHINWKEAYAVLFALAKWGHLWKGCTLLVMCDNSAIVHALNTRTIRGDAINPLQLIFLSAAIDDIEIYSEWLSTKENWIADALSRFDLKIIANLFPQLIENGTLRRQTGRPMLELRSRLQRFFGSVSLPHLDDAIDPKLATTKNAQNSSTYAPTPPPSNPSRIGFAPPTRRGRARRRFKLPSRQSGANTSTAACPHQSSPTTESNAW